MFYQPLASSLSHFLGFPCSCLVVSDPDVYNMLNPDACDSSMDWFYFFIFEVKKLPMLTCGIVIIFHLLFNP